MLFAFGKQVGCLLSDGSPLFRSVPQGGLQLIVLVLSKARQPFSSAGVGGLGVAGGVPHMGGSALGQTELANPGGLGWDAILKVVLFDV